MIDLAKRPTIERPQSEPPRSPAVMRAELYDAAFYMTSFDLALAYAERGDFDLYRICCEQMDRDYWAIPEWLRRHLPRIGPRNQGSPELCESSSVSCSI